MPLGMFRFQNLLSETYESIWTIGRTPWTGDQPDARLLPTQDNITEKRGYTSVTQDRSAIGSGKLKAVIYSEPSEQTERTYEQNEYRKSPKTSFTLSAKRTNMNQTSNAEMRGKSETVTDYLA
jgi:hypothetical protein